MAFPLRMPFVNRRANRCSPTVTAGIMLLSEWVQDSLSRFPILLVFDNKPFVNRDSKQPEFIEWFICQPLCSPSPCPSESTSNVPWRTLDTLPHIHPPILSTATTISCSSYCSCLLTGLPTSPLSLLFSFQTAFRGIFFKCATDYVTAPHFKILQWLPITIE